MTRKKEIQTTPLMFKIPSLIQTQYAHFQQKRNSNQSDFTNSFKLNPSVRDKHTDYID